MKIYFDACCLNRPFDDQSRERIRLEREAIELILDLVRKGIFEWYSSDVLEYEILKCPDSERRFALTLMLTMSSGHLDLDDSVVSNARLYEKQGLGTMDSLHLAIAIKGQCDVFLTTDDALLKKSGILAADLDLTVENPAKWILEVIDYGR